MFSGDLNRFLSAAYFFGGLVVVAGVNMFQGKFS